MNKSLLAAAAAATLIAGGAQAAVVVLNFEGIAPYPNGSTVQILDYYNGGTSSIGTTGTNYGVSFNGNGTLICLNTATICSNTSRGGLAPGSDQGALFFPNGSSTTLNYAAGFTTGFAFTYTDPFAPGETVNVYDGLNGTGALLATLALGLTADGKAGACPGFAANYCPFVAAGVSFAGTAHSIVFGGVTNRVVFDDITFGSASPGVPEPATWGLMLLGLAGVGAGLRQRKGALAG